MTLDGSTGDEGVGGAYSPYASPAAVDAPAAPAAPPAVEPPKGQPLVAWGVIVLVTGAIVALAQIGSRLSAVAADADAIHQLEEAVQALEAQALVVGAVFLAVLGVGLLGLIGLLVAGAALFGGMVRGRMGAPSGTGGVYAETFAVWLAAYVALSLAAGMAAPEPLALAAQGGAMLASLSALAWPVLRGVPWRQVRREVGWTAGADWALEPFWGLAAYAMALPLLGAGFVAFLLLSLIVAALGGESAAAHPIVFEAAEGGWLSWAQVFVLASVVAPLVEETMFRGVLYRHLREATARWHVAASFLASAAASSLVFAAVHPQGLLAVPPLAMLAVGFCLARELRGTLLPAMLAHAVHNGLLILLLYALLG